MQHATAFFGECEAMTAAGRLIMDSINRKTGKMTEQKGTNGTVANEDHITQSVSSQDVFDLPDNPRLSIDRPLPAPNADEWLRKKLIRHCLKLAWRQETCSRSIILVHRVPYLYIDVQFRCDDLGCLNRLSFSARDDLRCTRQLCCACQGFRARFPDVTQTPGRNRRRRINLDLRMGEVAYEACHGRNDGPTRACRQLALRVEMGMSACMPL
jgi:hypothetical protein